MEDNTILTKEEFSSNEAKKAKLEELIRSGDAILMAGAGVTAKLYCSWLELINIFQSSAQEIVEDFQPRGEKEDFLQFIDRVKLAIGEDRYYSILYDEFKDKPTAYEEFHKTIVRMPFKGFTTTNYDHVLDNALNSISSRATLPLYIDDFIQKREILDFIKSLNYNSVLHKRVMHLHGSYGVRSSIILSEKEYQLKYGFVLKKPIPSLLEELQREPVSQAVLDTIKLNHGLEWTMHRKLLWAILATRRVVFMGFSVTDPYFEKMLFSVREDLNTFGDDIHYVVMRITMDNKAQTLTFTKKLKQEYGLETVFFTDDHTYTGFERFITDLGAATIDNQVSSAKFEHVPNSDSHSLGNQKKSHESLDILKRSAEAINKSIRNED